MGDHRGRGTKQGGQTEICGSLGTTGNELQKSQGIPSGLPRGAGDVSSLEVSQARLGWWKVSLSLERVLSSHPSSPIPIYGAPRPFPRASFPTLQFPSFSSFPKHQKFSGSAILNPCMKIIFVPPHASPWRLWPTCSSLPSFPAPASHIQPHSRLLPAPSRQHCGN